MEQKVLLSLKKSDQKSFEYIFNKYYNQIYTFAANTLFDKIFAEDVAQSVFLTLWERRNEIDETKNIANYLYTLAKHNVYRQTERLLLKYQHEEFIITNQEKSFNIEEEINSRYLENILSELINKLPPSRREIFILSRKQHLTNREIASQLSISEKTVETQIRRTLLFLKEKMQYYLSILFF